MVIRDYQVGDAKQIADLFHDTVHAVCLNDYTLAQLEVWAPTPSNYSAWKKRCASKQPFIAEESDKIVGFLEFEADGHIDCLYVHHDNQHQGIATALYKYAESMAFTRRLSRVYTEASITAKPFFEKQNFVVLRKNEVYLANQILVNYSMEKEIKNDE